MVRFLSIFFITLTTVIVGKAQAQQLPTPSFPDRWQLNLQKPVTEVAQFIYEFHTFLLWVTTVITIFVLALLLICFIKFNSKANPVPSKTTHNTTLEVLWTVVPVIILIIIAVPSYRLLYFMDRIDDAELTVKVVGNQWYWSYEFPDYEIELIQLPLQEDQIDVAAGQHRLLEVDEPLVLPVNTDIRILFTSNDVIHAWTIPAFGIKMDNVPGRTNETWTNVTEIGRYYGQCSELCGVDHSYMPIVVDIVDRAEWERWKNGLVEEARGITSEDPIKRLAAINTQ